MMKFGLLYLTDYHPEIHGSADRLYEEMLAQIVYAEQLGFDSVWITEHHFTNYGGIFPSPSVFLAAVAQRTKRIRLGTGVVLVPLHNPIRLAEDYAMVDNLSDGRLEFGAGRAFLRYEYDNLNVSMDESSGRFSEGLEVIEQAWTQEAVNFEGRFFRVRDLPVLPKPKQKPRPPMWAAAQLTPASFEYIGKRGYHIMTVPYLAGIAGTKANLQTYRRALQESGRNPDEFEVSVTSIGLLAETNEQAKADVEPCIMRYIRTLTEAVAAGGEASQAEDYKHYRQHRSRLESLTFDQLFADEAQAFGDPEVCLTRVRALKHELGMTYFKLLVNFGGLSHHKVIRTLELFARYVMPHFSS
ncbi:MAG: LLM class flavin-dependent oxidoreductase [Acidobacteriota bacterium]|nr:LLM class flavin-dependent oxidoreductase [Blastocatellia bacterium]MDW8241453.1 LLM class flavin-dependent oxidoreductase [Acidobacteriota bacterium]